jgi:hypothetical protein
VDKTASDGEFRLIHGIAKYTGVDVSCRFVVSIIFNDSFLIGDNAGVEHALVLSSHVESGDEHCFFFCCDVD